MASITFTRDGNYDETNSVDVGLTPGYTGTGTSYIFDVRNKPSDPNNGDFELYSNSHSPNFFYDPLRQENFSGDNSSVRADFSDNTASVCLSGGNFGDVLLGGSARDTLNGGNGNDILEGGAGGDALCGGAGFDTASYEHASKGVIATFLLPFLNTGDARGDTYNSIENLRGSAYSDILTGDRNRNVIEGGGGADLIYGGGGPDYVSYFHSAEGVTVNLSTNINTGGDAQGDLIFKINNIYGSAQADNLTGNDRSNVINGLGGADTISGQGGNDRIILSSTPASVDGGDGYDTVVVAAGATVQFADGTLSGVERLVVYGGGNADFSAVTTSTPRVIRSLSAAGGPAVTITGSQAGDRIYGGAGTDLFDGGEGNDVFFAGTGATTFNEQMAGFGRDIVYRANLAIDTFNLTGLASDASELHFAAINGGVDTRITGLNSMAGDALVLKGITAADAQANGHFTFV